jgi:hypothetical protein
MNTSGLHNKPKTEVHPGHKLTGPKYEWMNLRWRTLHYYFILWKCAKNGETNPGFEFHLLYICPITISFITHDV